MKRVIIVHGWNGSKFAPMLHWLHTQLTSRGYEVHAPEIPGSEYPKIDIWVKTIAHVVGNLDRNTLFIGHSLGCQAILRTLQTFAFDENAGGMVFIAPWIKLKPGVVENEGAKSVAIARPWLKTPIDFTGIKRHTGPVVALFSDNDPYVGLDQEKFFKKELDAETIILPERGHFTIDDGVLKLPEALNAILEME